MSVHKGLQNCACSELMQYLVSGLPLVREKYKLELSEQSLRSASPIHDCIAALFKLNVFYFVVFGSTDKPQRVQ